MNDLMLRETGLKDFKRTADQISKMLDRFKQRLTLDNPRFIERYVKSELHILVHFVIGGTGQERVACFQRKQTIGNFEKQGWKACKGVILAEYLDVVRSPVSAEVETLIAGTDSNQQPMLINDVKGDEEPKDSCPFPP